MRRAAAQLVGGTVPFEGHGDLALPRLDAVIFNAGIGGWTGISWLGFAWDILSRGWIEATSRPFSKRSIPGLTVDPLPNDSNGKTSHDKSKGTGEDASDVSSVGSASTLGLVFCANVFGHYLLAHLLLPLLSREDDVVPPGRVIWQSSVAPALSHFDPADLQGLRSTDAYESSKMLTDVLCLTADLPSVRPHSSSFFAAPSGTTAPKRPNFYLAHPGIVATTMFPLHFSLMWGYILGTLLSRWLGSPWFPVYPYTAAVATVWLALAGQDELDAQARDQGNTDAPATKTTKDTNTNTAAAAAADVSATRVKWGSATDFWGHALVKKTEVDGWGWEGRVETDADLRRADADAGVPRALRKSVGRGAVARRTPMTEERRAAFEETGARCWAEMERLRVEWEGRLEGAGVGGNGKI